MTAKGGARAVRPVVHRFVADEKPRNIAFAARAVDYRAGDTTRRLECAAS